MNSSSFTNDRHVLAEVLRRFSALFNIGGRVGMVLVELGHQPEPLHADLGLGLAIPLPDSGYPWCDGGELVHSGIILLSKHV